VFFCGGELSQVNDASLSVEFFIHNCGESLAFAMAVITPFSDRWRRK
jgi:hypothetical protein